MPTHEEIEALVQQEAVRLCGKTVALTDVDGFCDGDVVAFRHIDPPVRARVLGTASTVIRWTDDTWCDPIYPVELLDSPVHLSRIESPWVYGTSLSIEGGREPAAIAVIPDPPAHSGADEDGRAAAARRSRP